MFCQFLYNSYVPVLDNPESIPSKSISTLTDLWIIILINIPKKNITKGIYLFGKSEKIFLSTYLIHRQNPHVIILIYSESLENRDIANPPL